MDRKATSRYAVAALAAAIAFALGFESRAAEAASDAYFMNVTAGVDVRCTMSITGVYFGTYDATDPNPNNVGAGSVTVNCITEVRGGRLRLDMGQHAAGGTRNMMNADGDLMAYALYEDAGRTIAFRNNLNVARTPATVDVFGQIPALQITPVGNYSDIVVVEMRY